MAINLNRKKVIIIAAAAVVLIVGGTAAYIFMSGQLNQPAENTTEPSKTNTSKKTYQDKLDKAQTEVTDLVAAGDEGSIQAADQIINAQVEAANESGDIAYVVDASSAKASLLIETERAPEALDLLLALEQQYGDEDEYKYELYAMISYAYKSLDNQAKSEEYLNKIPGEGWD